MASIITSVLGGNFLSGLASVINSIRGKSPEDAEKLAELAQKYQADFQQAALAAQSAQTQGQLATDKQEAANPNWFVAGWRPWVGWVCGFGLFFQFIVGPLATWGSGLAHHPVTFPALDMGTLMTLLGGLLGLGGMRSYEKVQGAANNH